MGTASTLLLRSPHCQVSDTSVTSLPAFILRLSISVWVISVRHSRVRTSLRSVLFREIAPRCLSERSFRVGWVGTPPTHGLCPSADPCLCCSFFPILFSTSFHNCPSSSADGLSAVLSPNVDFDLSQEKKKKDNQEKEGWLWTPHLWSLNRNSTCMKNQIEKGIKHGDFETRLSPIPWEAQKSGSHCQLPASVFQPYFQHRLEFFATAFGTYSPFLEREAYGNAWQGLRFRSPEVVNTITTPSSPESAPAPSRGQPQSSLQSARAVLSKALQDPRFSPRRFAGC